MPQQVGSAFCLLVWPRPTESIQIVASISCPPAGSELFADALYKLQRMVDFIRRHGRRSYWKSGYFLSP